MTGLNRIAYGLSHDEYRKAEGINCSGLKLINKSPAHYRSSIDQPREKTNALMIGSAAHCATLEPHKFAEEYIVMPDGLDKRTKEGKAAFTALEQSGKVILSNGDYKDIIRMARAVRSHETAGFLFNDGHAEVSVFTEIDEISAKCRLDWYRKGLIVDLKTTDDAGPAGFARSCANYGYDMQAAWYLDCAQAAGLNVGAFIFIAVEKSAPYAVALYELDADSIAAGRAKYTTALNKYRECITFDEWPGYSPDIVSIQLPAWAMKIAE